MHTQTLYKRSELSVKQEQTLKTPKVITHCIGFTSVFSLIGLENSHFSFDQSDAKTKINHDLFSHIFWIYYGLRVIFPLFETRCRVLLTWVSLKPKHSDHSSKRNKREFHTEPKRRRNKTGKRPLLWAFPALSRYLPKRGNALVTFNWLKEW